MTKHKLLIVLAAIVGTVLLFGAYRLFDGRNREAPAEAVAEAAPGAGPPATAPATPDAMTVVTAWRPFGAGVNDIAIGPPGERGADRLSIDDGDGTYFGSGAKEPPMTGGPGDESWRLRGAKREARVKRTRYHEPVPGRRTILTSGRRIGSPTIHLSDEARAALGLRDDDTTVRAIVCVSRRGRPTEVRILNGTGVSKVDESIARMLMSDRFRPLRQGGRRVDFCEQVTVVVPS